MPDNTYPPISSNTGGRANPRQLNRWIDVSPQGGKLKRTQSFISLPTFSQAVTWRGYSEIILAWNFTAPNNFVFTDISDLPSDPNYVLCIAYQRNDVVYRYKLTGSGGVFYFDIEQYVKQPILKNFRLEVWSIEDATVSEITGADLWTSVRGKIDYRFGDDTELVDNNGAITDFQSTDVAPALYTGYAEFLDPAVGVVTSGPNITTWTGANGLVLTESGAGNCTVGTYGDNPYIAVGAQSKLTSALFAPGLNPTFFLFSIDYVEQPSSARILFEINDLFLSTCTLRARMQASTIVFDSDSFDTTGITMSLTSNKAHTFGIKLTSAGLSLLVINLNTGLVVLEETLEPSIPYVANAHESFELVFGDSASSYGHYVYAAAVYNADYDSDGDLGNLTTMFHAYTITLQPTFLTLNTLSLPFVFPTNSEVPSNT